MKVTGLNTGVVKCIVPDTYGSGFQYEIHPDEWKDFEQLLVDKAGEYIKDCLSETDFKGAKLTVTGLWSPSEYNFRTDEVEFDLEFNDNMIEHIRKTVDDKFFEYIGRMYRSYDGFISFLPDRKEEFFACLNENESAYHGYRKAEQWKAIAEYISYQISQTQDLDKLQQDFIMDVWEAALREGMEIDEEGDYNEKGDLLSRITGEVIY